MATFYKTVCGIHKAIISKDSRTIKTKTFHYLKSARAWAKRIEGDRDAIIAYGAEGANIKFNDLAVEFMRQWKKKSGISGRATFWMEQFGSTKLADIEASMIRTALEQYAAGNARNGSQRRKLSRKRSPATVGLAS